MYAPFASSLFVSSSPSPRPASISHPCIYGARERDGIRPSTYSTRGSKTCYIKRWRLSNVFLVNSISCQVVPFTSPRPSLSSPHHDAWSSSFFIRIHITMTMRRHMHDVLIASLARTARAPYLHQIPPPKARKSAAKPITSNTYVYRGEHFALDLFRNISRQAVASRFAYPF